MSHARTQPPASSERSGSWWAFALRGLVAVLFGLLIIWPGFALYTLPLLIALLGAYILIDSIVTIVAGTRASGGAGGITARRNQKWIRSG